MSDGDISFTTGDMKMSDGEITTGDVKTSDGEITTGDVKTDRPNLSLLKQFFECALCNKPYTEPKLLLCFHTFCLACLEQWSRNSQLGGGGVGVASRGGSGPACPTCAHPLFTSKCARLVVDVLIYKVNESDRIFMVDYEYSDIGCCFEGDLGF